MKKIKQTAAIIVSLIVLFGFFSVLPVYAAGKITIEVSAATLNVGDTVKITARANDDAGAKVSTDLTFSYDSSKLEFVKCSEEVYSGGAGGSVITTASSASITLKATVAGSASVSVKGSGGAQGELTAGGATLTIAGGDANQAGKSPDNSLSSLKIAPGTLSPAFQYSTLSYTAEVAAEVTNVEVTATPTKEQAVVESITGNTDLKEGKNTISIVVKAENGATATYKIVVNRGAGAATPPPAEGEQTQGITLNGSSYNLSAVIPDNVIPEGFAKATVNCQGQEIEGLKSGNGAVTLIYLTTPEQNIKNTLAVFEEASGSIYPFRQIPVGDNFYIVLNLPAETGLTRDYTPASVAIGGYEQISAFTAENAEFYLVYALAKSGNLGWYRYDSTEGSFQRYTEEAAVNSEGENTADTDMKSLKNAYDKLDENYTRQKEVSRKTTAVMIFVMAVLIIVIVNLLIREKASRTKGQNQEDGEEEESMIFGKKKSFFDKWRHQEEDWEEDWEEDVIADKQVKTEKEEKAEKPKISKKPTPKTKPEVQPEPEFKPEPEPELEKTASDSSAETRIPEEVEDGFEVIDLDDL